MYLKLAFDFSISEIRHAWRIGTIAVVSYLLAIFVLNLQSPQWVMVTAIVCSQVNLGSTMRKSKQRLVGTILGAAFGLLVQYLFANYPIFLGVLFFLSTLIALQFIVRSYTMYTLFFTFAFILMMFFTPSLGFNVALVRIEDVVIGILIGTLGSLILWPDFASKMFTSDVIGVVSSLQSFFSVVIQWMNNEVPFENVTQQKIKSFNANQSARSRISEIYYELGLLRYPVRKYEKFVISQERIHYILLFIIQSIRYEKELHQDEKSLHFFVKKMIELNTQYSEIISKIPNVAGKLKNLPDLSQIKHPLTNNDVITEMDEKLFSYIEKLKFELKEMTRAVNEIIEYER